MQEQEDPLAEEMPWKQLPLQTTALCIPVPSAKPPWELVCWQMWMQMVLAEVQELEVVAQTFS